MTYVKLPTSDDPDMMYVISKWYKKVGDHVNEGEALMSYEAEKTAEDFEAPCTGTIIEINAPEDEPVEAGSVICAIE